MLDFRLDEEQRMLRDAIARYSGEQVRKIFRDAEEDGHIPAQVVQDGWDLGVLTASLPEAYGGFGEYSAVSAAIAAEELAWGDLAVALQVMVPNLTAIPVFLAGTDAQKDAYLPRCAGALAPRMTAALTEPVVTFDPFQLRTTAVRDDGGYLLNGTKTLVPLAETAEVILVYANEAGETAAFLVPADSQGLVIGRRDRLMGIQALPTYMVTLSEVAVALENRLGGDEEFDLTAILAHSRVALGAAAVGVARAGYEYALNYAKQRVQFGEPIAHRQSIAFMLADMATDIDEARLMVWEAAWKIDEGEPAFREATTMKQHVDRMVLSVTDRAVQILGGYGYIREYPVELWLRNARGFASFDGLAIV